MNVLLSLNLLFPSYKDQVLSQLGPHQSISEAAQAEGLELATKAP